MNIVSKKGYTYLFILIVFSYFMLPDLGYSVSFMEEGFIDSSVGEDVDSLYIAKAKKKKKGKKSKKKKGKKEKAHNKEIVSKNKATGSNNSYWGIGGGYLARNVGIIYLDVRKDIFSNIFVYVQGKYTLGCSEYFTLIGGNIGALYSYRMSELVEIAGGADFLVNSFSITDEDQMSKVYKDSSNDTTSMMLMYVEPRLSIALHFTPRIAIVLEAGASINIVAGEEVVEDVEGYIGTGFHFGAGSMFTF